MNSSAGTGLAALKRPPYDLLTVEFIKYNNSLGLAFIVQLFFKTQSPVTTASTKPAHLNIHHLLQMCKKAILRLWPLQQKQNGYKPQGGVLRHKAVGVSLIIGVFKPGSLWKIPTRESLQTSSGETWDFCDLIGGGKLWGEALVHGSWGILTFTSLLYTVYHDDKTRKCQRLDLSTAIFLRQKMVTQNSKSYPSLFIFFLCSYINKPK